MKNRIGILLLIFAATSCKANNNASLLITKVVQGTAGTAPGSPCVFDPGSTELSYANLNPAENHGTIGAVVQNTITSAATVNSFNVDQSAFLPHQAVVDYEVIGGTSPGEKIVPVSGPAVIGGSTGSIIVPLIPANTLTGPDGTVVRVTFHLEGQLVSGGTVHTSEREYLFVLCNTAGCSGNTCL